MSEGGIEMTGCCNEYRCDRKKPYLIRQGPFTGRWYLINDYAVKNVPGQVPDAEPLVVARRKHDITEELQAALLTAGWTPPDSTAK